MSGRVVPFRIGTATGLSRTQLRLVLYGVVGSLLVAVCLISRRQFFVESLEGTKVPATEVAWGPPSLVSVLPGRKIVQLRAEEAEEGQARNGIVSTEVALVPTRKKVIGFVGIQTGFGSAGRRRALRETWLPSTREGMAKLENETGLAFRFVIGYPRMVDAEGAAQVEAEEEEYGDFIRVESEEEYHRLPYKTLAFFRAAYALFDADFYVKADDDIYLRPDRLSLLLRRPRSSPRTYLGCMKKGGVISNTSSKWYEPRGYLLGVEYFAHAYGNIYALSRDVVSELAALRNDSMRLFSNEDVMVGAWMLAFNVQHEDYRTLCHGQCRHDSVAVWDMPYCSGLCYPEEQLRYLHAQDMCSRSPADPHAGPVKALEYS